MDPVIPAAAAGALSATALVVALETACRRAGRRFAAVRPHVAGGVAALLAPLRRAGAEGALPTDAERMRLCAAGAALGGVAGVFLVGPLAGIALGAIAGTGATRAVTRRRAAYAATVDAGVPAAAAAVADALAAGHSPRGSIPVAAAALEGPIARELSFVARDLEMGATTSDALARLRARTRSRGIDTIAAAISLQRRSGGDLARLMRDIARTGEEQVRLGADVRAATAQARFTALVVLAMGPLGLLLTELAAPGTLAQSTRSAVGLVLLVTAAGLQAAGAVIVTRLARLEP